MIKTIFIEVWKTGQTTSLLLVSPDNFLMKDFYESFAAAFLVQSFHTFLIYFSG